MVTNTQDSSSGRITAFASKEALVGYTWTSIQSVDYEEAKALAVWMNSTLGQIAMRRVLSRKLTWPMWQPGALMNVVVPNFRTQEGKRSLDILVQSYYELKSREIEQYRDGYTAVRQEIDKTVSKATNLSLGKLVDWGENWRKNPQ